MNNSEDSSPLKLVNLQSSSSLRPISPINSERNTQKQLELEPQIDEKLLDFNSIHQRSQRTVTDIVKNNFQTNRMSEFAKNSNVRRATVFGGTFQQRNLENQTNNREKHPDEGLFDLIFKNQEKKNMEQKACLKKEDLMMLPNKSRELHDINFSESIDDSVSESSAINDKNNQKLDQAGNSKEPLIKLKVLDNEDVEKTQEKKSIFENQIILADQNSKMNEEKKEFEEERTPLIEKMPFQLMLPKGFLQNILTSTEKSPKSARLLANSARIEKKETIRKEEKKIKQCMLLEEHLRQVHVAEFSILSLRNLETCQELLKDIMSAIEVNQAFEYEKALQIQDFLFKISKVGSDFLKYNKISTSYLIFEKDENKGLNIFHSRTKSSLMSMGIWQHFKDDSVITRDSKNDLSPKVIILKKNSNISYEHSSKLQTLSPEDKKNFMTLFGNESPHFRLHEQNPWENKVLIEKKLYSNGDEFDDAKKQKEKSKKFQDLNIFTKWSLFPPNLQQGNFLEDGIIPLKKEKDISPQHSSGQGQNLAPTKKTKFNSISCIKREVQKLRPKLSLDISQNIKEEIAIHQSSRTLSKEKNHENNGNSGVRMKNDIDSSNTLNKFFGETPVEKIKAF